MSGFRHRDWSGGLPDLPLSEVLRRLLPCLRSIYAFAATCQPWRRLLRASAAGLLRPGLPPLLLNPRSNQVIPFSQLVLAQPLTYRADLPAEATTVLSASRGRHLLLCRGSKSEARIIIIDALTGTERRELTLPFPHFAYHYAALTPSHLLVFYSKHAFYSLPLPFPDPNPNPSSSDPVWTKHSLPRSASFVTGVIEFRGRVLGLTARAQLLEFHLRASPPNQIVQMLPAAGLPDATTFDQWCFGPRLAAAWPRLLLVLSMLHPKSGPIMPHARKVHKVSVYELDMVRMRWEEVENIGAYSLFVDHVGKNAAACLDVGSCGVKENQVYVATPGCRWRSFPPGYEVTHGDVFDGKQYTMTEINRRTWPKQIWAYPQLFF
ncbi:hypothetical protein BS78_04G228900 [Paspalum vaginatum]|nr:hypothetical protein BS78_04G228900 [Paspalum vaginatum]